MILKFLSKIYSFIMDVRNWLYDRHILTSYLAKLPVISIGNISAGGNAKTPITIMLANELKRRGISPVVLSRGYGGKEKGPYLVLGNESPAEVGDEPLLIRSSTNLPVVVSRLRVNGAEFIAENNLGQVIVLDDGFQHRQLQRKINIVSIDIGSESAIEAFIKGEVLPLGRLRETRDKALKRVDIIIFSTRRYYKQLPPLDKRLLDIVPKHIPIFRSHLQPKGVYALTNVEILIPSDIVAFCGIAKPERFYETLKELGFNLINTYSFLDHHAFSLKELRAMRHKHLGAKFVCTEKDAVKLKDFEHIYVLKTDTVLEKQNEFLDLVLNKI